MPVGILLGNINGADFIHAFSLQEGGAKRKSHFAAQSCKKKRRIGDLAACGRRPALHGARPVPPFRKGGRLEKAGENFTSGVGALRAFL